MQTSGRPTPRGGVTPHRALPSPEVWRSKGLKELSREILSVSSPVGPGGASVAATVPPVVHPRSRSSSAPGKHVQVVCRIRKHEGMDKHEELFTATSHNSVTMKTSYADDLSSWRFHRVTQDLAEVYSSVRPVLLDVVSGINGAIIAYGQSGAGKTYSMFGSLEDDRFVKR